MIADRMRAETRVSIALFALTLTSGAVDAITFLGLGDAFAALATGNLLLLAFGVARAPGIAVGRPAIALGAFVLGAAVCDLVIARLMRRGRRWFVITLAAEVGMLAAAGLHAVAVGGAKTLPAPALALTVALLACAMGWRTRAMIETGVADMPTTVVQIAMVKALTDALSFSWRAARTPAVPRARRIATVLGIFVGGTVGALLLRLGPGPAILALTVFEACVVALDARAPRLRRPPPAEH
ncbi:YoaK family protein [Streptomyces herbicida]|uniref:YoaK family protein n=1 Tax=Streptomyces herbicida TaxID=3065675 RepID=UPI00292FCF99|nr:YoaK family protein [Streptomyces sp. NEAU-HV9]